MHRQQHVGVGMRFTVQRLLGAALGGPSARTTGNAATSSLPPAIKLDSARWIGRAVRGYVFGLCLAIPAAFAASGYDYSDSWWNPAESGWGLELVQQRDIVFATLYVYGSDGAARWYSGSLTFTGLTPQTRAPNYEGDLYVTTGPWFGTAPFVPSAVSYRKVGSMRIAGDSMTRATLSYEVDGVAVQKTIERMTFRFDDYAGDYVGTFIVTNSQCTNPASDGTRTLPATLAVTQAGTAMSIVVALPGKSCSYAGPYTQSGRLGQLAAGFTCTDGQAGTLFFEEMSVQRFGFIGRLFGVDNAGCHIDGSFAAAR